MCRERGEREVLVKGGITGKADKLGRRTVQCSSFPDRGTSERKGQAWLPRSEGGASVSSLPFRTERGLSAAQASSTC